QQLMHDARGVGLAATQVGILQRVFVFQRDEDDVIAVVNPVLSDQSDELESDAEGCLSLQGVTMPVERHLRVTVTGKDPDGNDLQLELEGHPARVVQHETDHLDGTLILDRTDDVSPQEALAVLRPRPMRASARAVASASRPPRRSALTSSSDSPRVTMSRSCSRARMPARGVAERSRHRPRSSWRSAWKYPFCSRNVFPVTHGHTCA